MAPAAPLARLDGLCHAFKTKTGGVRALDEISAVIPSGVITGVVGPDGAGKTTLLRHLAGLLRPAAGKVEVLGHDMAHEAALAHPFIGYMPQRFGLYEDLSVAENFNLFADLHGLDEATRAARSHDLFGFTGLSPFTDRLAGKLSGGMKQKLGLACALLARPRLLLLDEPSVGVDPASRRELWRIVERMLADSAGGMGVVWATSYLDEAERCASVLLLHEGKLLSSAAPADFLAPLAGRVYRAPVPVQERRRAVAMASALPGVLDALVQGDNVRLVLAPGAPAPDPAAFGATGLEHAAPRFEDGFVDLLRRASPPGETAPPPPRAAKPEEDGAPVIEVKDLVRRFGAFVAVDHASFAIARGEIFGLLGPNGAGKSTIFRMLCGLLRPSEGSAMVAGRNLLTAAAQARARLGYMAQKFSLYAELTVLQNLNFFARAYGLGPAARKAAVAAALARFELAGMADALAAALPLGLKQRLSLAAALLHRPDILFLDEPTSGVDPLTRRAFWAQISALAETGVTVLVTSHFMDEAEYCDRLAIIDAGKVLVTDTPAALRASVRSPSLPDPSLEDAFIALVEKAA